jgi:antitoxin HigA-1
MARVPYAERGARDYARHGGVRRNVGGVPRRTADTALRLGRYFATGHEFGINLQAHYDLESSKGEHGAEIERQVQPRQA